MDFMAFQNEIMEEIQAEEKAEEERRKEICKNGCPCETKIKRIGTFSKKPFLVCPVCFKQYELDGTEING